MQCLRFCHSPHGVVFQIKHRSVTFVLWVRHNGCVEVAVNSSKKVAAGLLDFRLLPGGLDFVEIQLLKFRVSDADLNQLASKTFSWPDAIRNVRFAVVPEGIRVIGHISTTSSRFRFQVLWQVSVSEGKLVGRIERLKAGFFSFGFLKSYLLNLIAAATGIAIRDEMLILDLDALLADSGWPVRVNLASIQF